jgi:hypothetical protein
MAADASDINLNMNEIGNSVVAIDCFVYIMVAGIP